MNFGEKLRQLRHSRNFTQPELAETLGIEQSYLSKLENAKHLPSSEILASILEVFNLPVGEMVDDLDIGERSRLRQIPAVADHFSHQKALIIGNRRRWIIGSMLLLAGGAALIYAGLDKLVVGDRVWSYASEGVVLEGEPLEIFRAVSNDYYRDRYGVGDDEVESLRARIDEDYIQTSEYRGPIFVMPVDGGSRTYQVANSVGIGVDPWQNKVAAMIGVFLLVLGASGIFLEKKLSRFQ
jgi:transcriptional regulator with XRE-family HTH domain